MKSIDLKIEDLFGKTCEIVEQKSNLLKLKICLERANMLNEFKGTFIMCFKLTTRQVQIEFSKKAHTRLIQFDFEI